MNRRTFLAAGPSAAVAQSGLMSAATAQPGFLELQWYYMHTTTENQMQRTSDFLKASLPSMEQAGAGSLGFFAPVIAPESPFILTAAWFPSLAAMQSAHEKMSQDKDYVHLRDAYTAQAPGYVRLESSLLRCFDNAPSVATLPTDEKAGQRVFELRMYESPNSAALARKIKMFNDAEIGIFRRLGMRPIFFGETIIGTKMPNLVYMLSFDDLAARDKGWQVFGADAEWQKLRAQPGLGDPEIVSNISNMILHSLPFSRIR